MRRLLGLMAVTCGAAALAADSFPVGKPDKMEVGQTVRYYLWSDPNSTKWNIRTTTYKLTRQFSGTVTPVGGTILGANTKKMEKKGKNADYGRIAEGEKELTFVLTTTTGMDGFDFTVSPDTRELIFDLKIDGENKGDRVFVGKAGRKYGLSKFTLPGPGWPKGQEFGAGSPTGR
jgi:hypothetical protein